MKRRRSGDLIAVIVLTLLALAAALFVDSGPLAVAAFLPLVLVLPGFALAAALFPPSSIGPAFRLILTIALSIAATALGAIVVQIFFGLDRGVFAAMLALIALGASAKAMRSRPAAEGPATRLSISPRWILPALATGAAVAIAASAVAIATNGAEDQLGGAHFSALWLLPEGPPGTPPGGPPVSIGVASHESRELGFRLELRRGSQELRSWRLRLSPGEEWHALLPASSLRGSGALTAQLLQGALPVRRVAVLLDSEAGAKAE
jgi:hypothetical protein